MSDSEKSLEHEKALADLNQKRDNVMASCAVFLEHLENLDCRVKDIDDPFVAFMMMDVKESADSFVNDFMEFLKANKKSMFVLMTVWIQFLSV